MDYKTINQPSNLVGQTSDFKICVQSRILSVGRYK